MELRTTRELRRNAQIDKSMRKKAETPDASAGAGAKPARTGALTDKMTLSQQAVEYIDRQREQLLRELAEHRAKQQGRWAEAQAKSGELDLLSEGLKVLELCQKIAASIMKGNRVPPQDLEFLLKNDPDGYRLAMALRRHNPDPEDEESVLPDEDENGGRIGETGGGESPSVEASGPSGGASGSSGGGGDAAANLTE